MKTDYFRWSAALSNDAVMRRLQPADGALPDAVVAQARAILDAVRTQGDAALIDYSARFDKAELTPETIRVSQAEISASASLAAPDLRAAIDLAIANVRAFHALQKPRNVKQETQGGGLLELIWRPVAAAALYVPGGRAAYPSTVIMNAVPAIEAGVPRIAVFTVPGTIESNPAVAYALQALGLTEVYRVAGAQAIGAAAFGTESVAPVQVIVGPGNAWVAAAKREVYGRVGIDSIAGPSEVLILCDDTAKADWVALDMMAQAEHDPMARVVVACTDEAKLQEILASFIRQTESSPRAEIIRASWLDHGLALLAENTDDLLDICTRMAPEHLQVILRHSPAPHAFVAGAMFFGNYAPTAAGDYIAGPNHVLPTGGSARFAGPLGVQTFMRPSTVVLGTSAMMNAIAGAGAVLADHERLPAHAAALRARISGE